MAGDWIPRCKGLNRKPEVLAVSRLTGLTRHTVADLLMEFWEWADSETQDGILRGLTLNELLQAIHGTDERFWLAVVQSGWLQIIDGGLAIPNFERWLGRNAKRRLLDAKRKQLERMSASKADKSVTTGQDRTEGGMNSPLPPSCPEPDVPAHGPKASTREVDSAPAAVAVSEPRAPDAAPADCNGGAARGGLFEDASASPADADPVLLVFPTVGTGAREWALRESKWREYSEAFPALDVLAECREALQWLRDNPRNAKTARGRLGRLFICKKVYTK